MAEQTDRLDRPVILGLVAMALAVLVVANDFTALSVALPAPERDLPPMMGVFALTSFVAGPKLRAHGTQYHVAVKPVAVE